MTSSNAAAIHVIGVGASGAAGLAPAILELIHSARLLCGGSRLLGLFPQAGAERFTISGDLASLYRRLDGAPDGAVVLASGDPCFYGIGPLLVKRFGGERVMIHPAPSSVSLAFARLGLAWHDAVVLSVHGRPLDSVVTAAMHARKLAILTDPDHTPAKVAASLVAAGMPDCPAFVCERLEGPDERIHATRLLGLPERCFDPLNVLILLPGVEASEAGAFSRGDDAYASLRGQITKAEVRAVTIAKLEPWRATVCWDIGAGSGSVAIEAAGFMRGGAVFAVEKDPEQIAVLRANLGRHHPGLVHVIEGSAPAACESLPAPDAVFVGGAGGELAPTLRLVARRLAPGGRLVANFARLESLSAWQAFAATLDWPSELCEIAVSRGQPLAAGTRLAPLGPVFITRLVRPRQAP